ncbi:MAG TPA: hypothetical protein VMF11_03195 [Candidatus Baltobacteraceae bacterium]|nr:hypothetical protein [Candidatus Baltobacteraceae bacterium]
MSVQWLEQPDSTLSPAYSGFYDGAPAFPNPTLGTAFGGDSISQFAPNGGGGVYGSGAEAQGGASSIVQQLMSMIQQLLEQMGFGAYGGTGASGNEQYFSSASGGSNGDPHLSFNGSTWNDMNSEPDLLNSDSIRGGYRLSTQTTAPNANGVTYNQSATVTTHRGQTQVSLDNNGNAAITQDGVTTSIAPGQTVQLGNETVTRNQNGSLRITCSNENGGQITTTMSDNGSGVDVNVSASSVDLGGTMVNGANQTATAPTQPAPPGRPIMHRYGVSPNQFE